MKKIEDFYNDGCFLCGNMCGVKRISGEKGKCNSDDTIYIASRNLHFGEEPPISGYDGSGTIFFTNCSLKCIYCQNYPISQFGVGKPYDEDRLINIILELQKKKAKNINLVTPTHYSYHIYRVIKKLKEGLLNIPVVWNTSSYENPEIVDFLDDVVDIYLADIRYSNNIDAEKYSSVKKYTDIVFQNVIKFFKQKGNLQIDEYGYARKGLLVRILVLPGMVKNAKEIIKFCYDNFGKEIYLSLMSQYTPYYKALDDQNLKRRIKFEEYQDVVNYARNLGLENCFIQEIENVEEKCL